MLHRLEFHAMGSEMLALMEHESMPPLLAQIPLWFEEWEQVLSRFRYDSELTHLNQIHAQPVPVSDILWDVLQTARNAERLTDGLVTPTLLDAIVEAGYDRSFDVLPHQAPATSDPVLTAPQPLTAIAVNDSTRTITLPTGMSLDFGGSAKGWAAHQAMKRLQACTAVSHRRAAAVRGTNSEQGRSAKCPVLVNAGGDIAISGPRLDGSPWPIGIADPFQREENLEILYVNECGVATSGKDRRRWTRNGVLQHHIIDPATNQPSETDLMTVTVVAPDVMQAEAAAKAAFILGSRAGLEWVEARSQFAALFVLDNGQVLYSNRMEEFL